MMYDYNTQRPKLFTDGKLTDKSRAAINEAAAISGCLLKEAGAFKLRHLYERMVLGQCNLFTNWDTLAVIDYMVEVGILREVVYADKPEDSQDHRIFVRA